MEETINFSKLDMTMLPSAHMHKTEEDSETLEVEEMSRTQGSWIGKGYPTILLLSSPRTDWARRLGTGNFGSLSASDLNDIVDELSHCIKPKFTGGVDFHLNLSENVFKDPEC